MSKKMKIWLVAAAVLVMGGAFLFVGVMAVYGWDFSKLGTVVYVTNTYEADGDFDKISINVYTTQIAFAPAEDENCSIVCLEPEKVRHSAVVQNDTLIINTTDTRKWYDHIGISFGTPKMTIYLPEDIYTSLLIETDTGNITIPKDFSFETINIEGDTCDVDCFADASDIIEVEVDTGDINLDTITAKQLKLTSDIGDIRLDSVVAAKDIYIETDTGNVRFENSDAAQIFVKTDVGDVTGTLLSEKVFITKTSTGRISVPKTTSGGKCEIITSTGDIKIDVLP